MLEEYNSGRRVNGTVGVVAVSPPFAEKPDLPPTRASATPVVKPTPEPEPEPTPEPEPVVEPTPEPEAPATIRELEEEIARLRAQVEKYVPVMVNIPRIGDVELSRAEAHNLLQQLLEQAQGGA